MIPTELGRLIALCDPKDALEAGIIIHKVKDGEFRVALKGGDIHWGIRVEDEFNGQFSIIPEGLIHTEELEQFWKSLQKLFQLKEQRDEKAREILKSHDQFRKELKNLKFCVFTKDGGMKHYG